MNFFSRIFKKPAPIRDVAALADFIDSQTAFYIQKGIYEYARARAGHYSKVMFREKHFADSVELSRWKAYPLGLSIIGEMVEGVLRPHAGDKRRVVLDNLISVVGSVFDRYPVPPLIGEDAWRQMRVEMAQRLEQTAGRAPKMVKDIPEPLAETYFDLMPIHESLRGRDFSTTRNYMRVSLCNIHDVLVERLDTAAVASELSR